MTFFSKLSLSQPIASQSIDLQPTDLQPITLQSIDLSYQKQPVFKQLTMAFATDGISFLVGSNGAGKTQLLRLVHGLVRADNGQLNAPAVRRQAYLRQQPILLRRSVAENLAFVRGSPVCSVADFDKRIDAVIVQFGLQPLLKQSAMRLSGGQQKRLACARLWLQSADYYLLDEPSANIDHKHNRVIESAIEDLQSVGKKVIIATHDFFMIERLFTTNRDELVILQDGQWRDTLHHTEKLKNYL